MFSKSLSATVLLLSSLVSSSMVQSVSAGPVVVAPRDVFDPTILSPTVGTVWTIGSTQNVTWSTANAPQNITDKFGMIVLAKNKFFVENSTGAINPLASGFDILQGFAEVTVPDVAPDDDYEIILFGDSSNITPDFTISE